MRPEILIASTLVYKTVFFSQNLQKSVVQISCYLTPVMMFISMVTLDKLFRIYLITLTASH